MIVCISRDICAELCNAIVALRPDWHDADPEQGVIKVVMTGFDAPCCHTMHVDKPMKGHNLMQAIARVNRVFRNKPGGLVVNYIGIANELKAALKTYTESKGRGDPAYNVAEALAVLLEKPDIVRGLMHGFDYSGFETDSPQWIASALTRTRTARSSRSWTTPSWPTGWRISSPGRGCFLRCPSQ